MSEEKKSSGCCEVSDCKCDAKDIEENKGLAAISYLWILFLIPLLGKKDSAYCQFHAKQGLALLVFWIASGMIMMIPVLGWFVGGIGYFVAIVFAIMGIINALSGKCCELPWIGGWFKNIKF